MSRASWPRGLLLVALAALAALGATPAAAAWRQDRFLVGAFCVNPAPSDSELVRLDRAGLDYVVNFSHPYAPDPRALADHIGALRARVPGFHLRVVLEEEGRTDPLEGSPAWMQNHHPTASWPLIRDSLATYPADTTLGFFLWDEPQTLADLDSLAVLARLVASSGDQLALVNLLPATGAVVPAFGRPGLPLEAAIVDAYPRYLDHYLSALGPGAPTLLSVDHYPFWRTSADPEPFFYCTLKEMSEAVRAHDGVGFQYVAQIGQDTVPREHGLRCVPLTEARIRMQVWSGVAYGAKAIGLYVAAPAFQFAGGLVDSSGAPTPAYPMLRGLIGELHTLGPWLMPLTWVKAYHVSALGQSGLDADTTTAGTVIARATDGHGGPAPTALVSQFTGGTDVDFLMVVNKETATGASPRTFEVTLQSAAHHIERIDRASGQPVSIATNGDRFTLTLAPGDAELYRITW